jgi:predicted secreted Zn-dependent protease
VRPLILLPLLLLALLAPGPAPARSQGSITHPQPGLTVSVRNVYYRIQGRTAADLRAQMNRLGPLDSYSGKRYDAYANWSLTWRVRDLYTSAGCRITGATVLVELGYTYPRWAPPPSASTQLRRKWQRYLKALHKHENGHGSIAAEMGRKMLRGIRSLAPRNSCRSLEAAVDQVGADGVERTNRAESAYDARTNHGTTQGARFP